MPDRLTPAEYRALTSKAKPEPSGGADGTRCREAMSSPEHEAYRREGRARIAIMEAGQMRLLAGPEATWEAVDVLRRKQTAGEVRVSLRADVTRLEGT